MGERKKKNDCHFTNTGHVGKIFYVHIPSFRDQIWGQEDDDDNGDTQQTIHGYIGSLTLMPNEPNRLW